MKSPSDRQLRRERRRQPHRTVPKTLRAGWAGSARTTAALPRTALKIAVFSAAIATTIACGTGCHGGDPIHTVDARLPFELQDVVFQADEHGWAYATSLALSEVTVPEAEDAFRFEGDDVLRDVLQTLYDDPEARYFTDGVRWTDDGIAVYEALRAAHSQGLDPMDYGFPELQELAEAMLSVERLEALEEGLVFTEEELTLVQSDMMGLLVSREAPTGPEAMYRRIVDTGPSNPTPEYARRFEHAVDAMTSSADASVALEFRLAAGVAAYARDQVFFNVHNTRQREELWTWQDADQYVISNGERPERVRDYVVVAEHEYALDEVPEDEHLAEQVFALFDRAAEAGFASVIVDVRPPSPQWPALVDALDEYQRIALAGGWQPLSGGARLRVGQSDDLVPEVAARLAAEGYYDGPVGDTEYTYDLESAMRAFQRTHAVDDSGRLNSDTEDAINLPLEARIAEILLSMQRVRESRVGSDAHEPHVWVNVAGQYGNFWRDDALVHDWNTVVGRYDWRRAGNRTTSESTRTPLFSDVIETVIINPYWYIPQSIIQNEIEPRFLAEGYPYLDARGYEVIRETPNLILRQRPGRGNALGQVKFLFYNRFNVYLHDTPSRSLFNEDVRAFSHGCVRVEDPLDLAAILLSHDRDWSLQEAANYVDDELDTNVEQIQELHTPLPIHIEYVPVSSRNGALMFHGDVYRYEEDELEGLTEYVRRAIDEGIWLDEVALDFDADVIDADAMDSDAMNSDASETDVDTGGTDDEADSL